MTAPYEELTTEQRIKRAGLVGASFYGTTLHDSFTSLIMALCESSYEQGYSDAQRIGMGVEPIDLKWDVEKPEEDKWETVIGCPQTASAIDLP